MTTAEEPPKPLAPEWLLEPLPAASASPQELESTDSRFEAVSSLILRGDYIVAGRKSEELFHEGIYDVRVLGYYLFGTFVERGLPSLPLIFRILIDFLEKHYPTFGPGAKKQVHTDNMLLWLISGILKNAELHSVQKDAAWKEWMDPKHRPAIDEALLLCPQVLAAIHAHSEGSRAATRFQSLDGWLNGLGTSETGVNKRIPSQGSDSATSNKSPVTDEVTKQKKESDEDADENEDEENESDDEDSDSDKNKDEDDNEDEHQDKDDYEEDERHLDDDEDEEDGPRAPRNQQVPMPRRQSMQNDGSDLQGSEAWQLLLERLQAFQNLVARGQYLKAAVVSTDIQAALANFDPVTYFPGVFSPYLSAFSEHMRPLEHYLGDTEGVKFRVLRQLYRANFDKFMNND